ncbi:MAG: DUF5702 domain-containing protein [Oscillospiraceae bacterium]|nr:DUF5702 domain-containing protein [Oscillospiraceae bacterium]
MLKFIRNTKGAVTVFVTLLLIPAVLISGTAVDLARIHTARSIVQDANQLAANSVLTQYNALLKDLYGLFGVAEDDPILWQLLDEYIAVSIFGEDGQDRSLGTLQLFYGSNISLAEPYFADGKDLRNEDVLRRQIEEYMKFRGPVIIVQDILELLGSSSFREDSGVIKDKLEIESAIAGIYEKYKELYNAIVAADRCDQVSGGLIGGTVATVSSSLELIRQQFVNLRACYVSWEKASTSSAKNDIAARYEAILANIRSRTIGGPVGSNWSNGRWQSTTNPQGLNKTIEGAKERAERFKQNFDRVVSIAQQLDAMKAELEIKIDSLEQRINSGESNAELRAALTERTGTPPKSIMERYRDILKWDLEPMAIAYKDNGYHYLDNIMKPLLDSVMYRNINTPSGESLTRAELENIQTNPGFALSESVLAVDSLAEVLGNYTVDNITYGVPPGFIRFSGSGRDNRTFFAELEQMMRQPDIPPVSLYDGQEESGGANAEAKQRGMIRQLLDQVNSAFAGFKNEPLGARYINNNADSDSDAMDMQNITGIIPQALNEPVSNVISDPLGSVMQAADYLLLLSYCTSVFSNYTTTRPDTIGMARSELGGVEFPKSITGVPISPQVNYFFQSEWEYLYNGSENAAKNLNAVTRLIFLVRLICNYITVFSVREVTTVINGIKTAFAWNPPLALILGELARAAFVAAESAVDVASLRSGEKVPLIKSGRNGEWVCSPGGLVKALADTAAGTVNQDSSANGKGLSYSNYMTFFFLAKGLVSSGFATELTGRTANLIEWNVLNYKGNTFGDESQMSSTLSNTDRFRLVDMKTDVSLTTTAEMRMLFLSMIFAQNFSDTRGIGIPSTMPLVVTDRRGY